MLTLPPTVDAPLMRHGDCLELLLELPDASVDVVVTDPPAGIGFMAKPWDSFKGYKPRTGPGRDIKGRLDGLLAEWAVGFLAFMTDVWTEVDRVLKPGGFVCAWALPKTADLAGLALRAVGWEMHDSLLHLFGGGMKKGIDIGKAIDAQHGAEREVVGKAVYAGGHVQNSHADRSDGVYGMAGGEADARAVTAPATDDARRWDGWHSQLAPGHEQWLLARKPTRLTYARQVLTHCTGGLHVDACRIPRTAEQTEASRVKSWTQGGGVGRGSVYGDGEGGHGGPNPGGSWPRNVLLSCGGEDCPAEALDRQSGVLTTGGGDKSSPTSGELSYGARAKGEPRVHQPDTGGASRFFTKFDDRAWYGGKAHRRDIPGTSRRISHPTHKNPELMRWLVRLLAATCEQTGGEPAIVLDPFGGSFTTAWACVAEGVRCITIERDLDSFSQGRARVLSAIGSPEFAAEANAGATPGDQTAMF